MTLETWLTSGALNTREAKGCLWVTDMCFPVCLYALHKGLKATSALYSPGFPSRHHIYFSKKQSKEL